ncbi:MAG TPA: TldD/PmbA family protein [Candidatus Saccharimonadales bacterium]|nr:TldD/PmbA family protein [Candidatus Saccharimonadales bacterium]
MSLPAPFRSLLDEAALEAALRTARGTGAHFAEVFLERRDQRSIGRREGRVETTTASTICGAGVRALSGAGTGYAWTSSPSASSLADAARAASRIAAAGSPGEGGDGVRIAGASAAGTEPAGPGSLGDLQSRADYLEELDSLARAGDARVSEVSCSVGEEVRTIHVANSEGRRTTDEQILSIVRAAVYVRGAGGTQRGQYGGGGREAFAPLSKGRLAPGAVAGEALRRALLGLDAREAPTGEMPVLIGNGWGGVLLHEAIGHGFEADFVQRGTSIFAGKLGERVASPLCTVVDDSGIAGLRGSYRVDDEGTPARRTCLIEKGILTGYLHDLLSAAALGMEPTGNGRRHSFRTPPIPRQSNLFMEAGDREPEELLGSVRRGFYAKGLGGGQVDIVSGRFVFEVTEGYLIEEGRATAPVRGANLIGSGREVLMRIEGVGSDFSFDPGTGTCGKDGQSQPVGVGQPTVLVSAMTIGGTRL